MVGGREGQFDLVGNRPVAESVFVAGFFWALSGFDWR